jgi:hypothetical protein
MSIARQILDYKKELKSEAKGMGQEGRAYMRDKLKGKKYGGKLKDKYKDELAKEAFKLSPKGKKFLKKELDKPKKYAGGGGVVHHPVKAQPEDLVKKKKDGGEIKEYSGGGKVEITPKAKQIPKELEKASKMHKSQAERLKKMGFKDGGEIKEYSGGGEAKDWIQGAVKKPGALRAVAKKEGLIKGDENLSGSDLSKLAAQAKKKNNKLLAKRVSLAKTFAKMRKS